MDPEGKKFGGGPRELSGAIDLISHFKLLPYYKFFCKRPLPVSISDTHYLHSVGGDTEIRRGDGMQLDQLIQNTFSSRDASSSVQLLDLNILKEAFQLKDTGTIDLPSLEKGIRTVAGKSKSDLKDKNERYKKHKDRDKNKEQKKHKHHSEDRSKDRDKEKKKDKSGHHDSSADHSRKHHEKKRKDDGDEDLNDVHKHKK